MIKILIFSLLKFILYDNIEGRLKLWYVHEITCLIEKNTSQVYKKKEHIDGYVTAAHNICY